MHPASTAAAEAACAGCTARGVRRGVYGGARPVPSRGARGACMRAAVMSEPGGPEVFRIEERPDPRPGPDEVLLAVHASALNRADLGQRRGGYPAPPGIP